MPEEIDSARTRKVKLAAFFLIVAFVVAGVGAVSFYYPKTSETQNAVSTSTKTDTGNSSSYASSNPLSGQPYFNASKVYASLGYPKILYNYWDTPYAASKPNFTLEYRAKDTGFHVGTIVAPVLSLNEATKLAADYAKLDPSNYTLGQAVFTPGTVINSKLMGNPVWYLYFAEIHDGYWIFDNYGPQSLSVEVAVDATNGTVWHLEGDQLRLSKSGQYELRINSSRALETVRTSNLSGVPSALTEKGTVRFMEPRVVIPNQSPSTRGWLDSFLSGSKLLWIIELGYSNYHGVFVVDAVTGNLVTGSAGVSLGMHLGGAYYGSVAFSTARNLTVAERTFRTNGTIIGRPGSVEVAVPDVLIVKPGTAGSIQLNYTNSRVGDPNINLSFADPLPDLQSLSSAAVPPGVSLQFSNSTMALPSNGTASATLLISVDKNAPSGTYLLEVDATNTGPYLQGKIQVLFFFSVWKGSGEWPPPPMVK